jgi:hypothetical protein
LPCLVWLWRKLITMFHHLDEAQGQSPPTQLDEGRRPSLVISAYQVISFGQAEPGYHCPEPDRCA